MSNLKQWYVGYQLGASDGDGYYPGISSLGQWKYADSATAYKYTKQEKQISVGVKDRDGQVVISIEDNGIGISAKEVERIFDPFYRVDTRLRGESTGAGLGLAIVRHLVKTHKGEVLVESREGQGSSFSVLLPRAKSS